MFKGTLNKEGKYWVVVVPQLDMSTFATTKKGALAAIEGAVEGQVDKKGFKADAELISKNEFCLAANNDKYLMALFLKRQRGKYGLSLTDMAKRLDRSVNFYAQYEQGKSLPSIPKLEEFLHAMQENICLTLDISSHSAAHAVA